MNELKSIEEELAKAAERLAINRGAYSAVVQDLNRLNKVEEDLRQKIHTDAALESDMTVKKLEMQAAAVKLEYDPKLPVRDQLLKLLGDGVAVEVHDTEKKGYPPCAENGYASEDDDPIPPDDVYIQIECKTVLQVYVMDRIADEYLAKNGYDPQDTHQDLNTLRFYKKIDGYKSVRSLFWQSNERALVDEKKFDFKARPPECKRCHLILPECAVCGHESKHLHADMYNVICDGGQWDRNRGAGECARMKGYAVINGECFQKSYAQSCFCQCR